jgi:hypothetical protein
VLVDCPNRESLFPGLRCQSRTSHAGPGTRRRSICQAQSGMTHDRHVMLRLRRPARAVRRYGRSGHFLGLSIVQQPTAAPGHPDRDGQADARRPRPWLAPGMRHPRIPLPSRMSRAARAASLVRDPPGAALTWVRRCLAVWVLIFEKIPTAEIRAPSLS